MPEHNARNSTQGFWRTFRIGRNIRNYWAANFNSCRKCCKRRQQVNTRCKKVLEECISGETLQKTSKSKEKKASVNQNRKAKAQKECAETKRAKRKNIKTVLLHQWPSNRSQRRSKTARNMKENTTESVREVQTCRRTQWRPTDYQEKYIFFCLRRTGRGREGTALRKEGDWIDKRGDLTNQTKYRWSTLLPIPGEVFNSIILHDIKNQADTQLCEQ